MQGVPLDLKVCHRWLHLTLDLSIYRVRPPHNIRRWIFLRIHRAMGPNATHQYKHPCNQHIVKTHATTTSSLSTSRLLTTKTREVPTEISQRGADEHVGEQVIGGILYNGFGAGSPLACYPRW